MKKVLLCLLIFCAIALPALGELTDADLDKIRLIVQEEIKAEISKTNEKIDKLEERLRTVETDVATIKGYQTGEQTGAETKISWVVALASVFTVLVAIAALVSSQLKKDPQLETFSRVIENLVTSRTEEKTTQSESENTDTTNVSQQV